MESAPEQKQRMRVLYCILDNRFGGPHRRALILARRLRECGVQTLFLLGQKTEDLWRPEGFDCFPCRHIQCFTRRRPLWNFTRFCCLLPSTLLKTRRIIQANGVDLVHIDGVTNFVPALAARLAGMPVVWHYNDHLPGPLKRLLLPLVTRLAARVIVQGEGLRRSRTAGNTRLRDKTIVLYPAVDTREFAPEAYDRAYRDRIRRELGVPAGCTLVGTIGNLNRFKGQTHFLEAAARIRERSGPVKFLLVGRKLDTDPDYWQSLQELTVRLGLQEDVVYAGFRDDVPALLAALDVFVLPSVLESCPVVLLEAMAMKVPVVATDVGAVTELVADGHSGLLVPPGDGAALADAVLAYLAKPEDEVRRMVETARKTVEDRFALDTIALQQLRIYESIGRRRMGPVR